MRTKSRLFIGIGVVIITVIAILAVRLVLQVNYFSSVEKQYFATLKALDMYNQEMENKNSLLDTIVLGTVTDSSGRRYAAKYIRSSAVPYFMDITIFKSDQEARRYLEDCIEGKIQQSNLVEYIESATGLTHVGITDQDPDFNQYEEYICQGSFVLCATALNGDKKAVRSIIETFMGNEQ